MIQSAILFTITAAGLLTMWAPGRWALTAFQLALLGWVTGLALVRGVALHPAGAAVAGLIAWGGVQVLLGWTVDSFRTEEAMLDWTVRLAGLVLAMQLDARGRERFLDALVAFAAGLSVLAMATVFSSQPGVIAWWFDTGSGVPTLGPFVYRNQYAAFVEAVLPVALVRAYGDRERAWWHMGAVGLLFASVIASGSRAGAVLCVAEVAVVPLLAGRGAWRAGAGILGSIGVLTLAAGWQNLWLRFQQEHPYELRWNLVRSSWEMFLSRPVRGFGLGTWAQAYPGFALYDDGTFVNQAHNDWAQWAVEGGLPVLGCMLVVAGCLWRPAVRSWWGVGMLAVLLHCLVDYPMQQRPALGVFFFIMIGLILRTGELRPTFKIRPPLSLRHT